MWISVRIETPFLDTSVQLSLAQLEAARVSQGRVSIQRHRTLSSVLATRGYFFVPRQETKILVPYSSWPGKGSPGMKKRIKRLRSCPANMKTALANYRLLPHFRAVSCCSLCYQAEKRHLPPIPPTEEEVHSYSLPLLPLQTRTGLFHLRTARQLPVHPSDAQLTELSAGWGQQRGSQSYTAAPTGLCSGKGGTEVAPWLCPCRELHQQAGRSFLGQRSFIQASPGAST